MNSLPKSFCESAADFARKFRRSCHRRTWRHRVSLSKTRCASDVREKTVRQKIAQTRSKPSSKTLSKNNLRRAKHSDFGTTIEPKSTENLQKSFQNRLFRPSWVDWGRRSVAKPFRPSGLGRNSLSSALAYTGRPVDSVFRHPSRSKRRSVVRARSPVPSALCR